MPERPSARLALVILVAAVAGAAPPSHAHEDDPSGHTTVEQTIVEGPVRDPARPGFSTLVSGPGSPYVVRRIGTAIADPGRVTRRRSLAYFGQLTDFQLADEESPRAWSSPTAAPRARGVRRRRCIRRRSTSRCAR